MTPKRPNSKLTSLSLGKTTSMFFRLPRFSRFDPGKRLPDTDICFSNKTTMECCGGCVG